MSRRVFDRYEVIRRIAMGGMGEIFLARQRGIAGFDRLVILKSLLPELTLQRDQVQQFLDEARVAATLSHPNIVAIYEVGEWEGLYYIAMEYIAGISLAELMGAAWNTDRWIPVAISAQILRDAALGLDHAHRATSTVGEPLEVIHRDISPQNVMVRNDGVTKIVDFGIAKAANRATKTATGMLKGKLTYMAPEQLDAAQVDHRADQFSLGVVAWELLTGERLFQADSALETVKLITEGRIRRPREASPEVPEALDAIVVRMLEREPAARYPSCADVARELELFLGTTATSADAVATLVDGLCGEKIAETTRDLTPQETFAVPPSAGTTQLGHPATEREGATVELTPREEPRGRWRGPAAAAVLFAILAGAAVLATRPPASEPAVVMAPRQPSSRLEVDSRPSAAIVLAGGRELGRTPLATDDLEPGEHTLEVRKTGYESLVLTVRLVPGATVRQTVALVKEELAPPPRQERRPTRPRPPAVRTKHTTRVSAEAAARPASAAAPGFITVMTTPFTTVYLEDGTLLGEVPIPRTELSAGRHTLRFVNRSIGLETRRPVVIRSGETTKLKLTLR